MENQTNKETIRIVLPGICLGTLDSIAENLGTDRAGAVNALLGKLYEQTSGYGKQEADVIIPKDHIDYVFGHAAHKGLSPEEAVNAAIDELRTEWINSPERPEFGHEVEFEENGKIVTEYVSLQDILDGARKSVISDVKHPSELTLNVTDEIGMFLLHIAEAGTDPGRLVSEIIDMYLMDFLWTEGKVTLHMMVSAENAEFLRRHVFLGQSWYNTISFALEMAHQEAVSEAKREGISLTEREKELEDIGWQ